jgi:tetratricopeptide (TPR) repeat protein
MEDGQMGAAVDDFTRAIEIQPQFAEGWNKRATAYYLMGDLEQSLHDCDEVIRRNPSHFGALSGYGLIYVQRGELERALEYFERALAINPNLEGVQQSIELIEYRLGQEGKRSI